MSWYWEKCLVGSSYSGKTFQRQTTWRHLIVKRNKDWNCLLWPGTTVTICVSYFMTRGPSKELGASENLRKIKMRCHRSYHLPGSLSLAPLLAEQWMCHQEGPEVRMTGHRQPGNEPHHHKTQDCHTAEKSSWVPSSYCSPPGHLFPMKSLALSASVSPQTIHFWVLDKRPLSGPGRGPPSCNIIPPVALVNAMGFCKSTQHSA